MSTVDHDLWGRPPGLRPTPSSASEVEPDQGVRRGRGRPPHGCALFVMGLVLSLPFAEAQANLAPNTAALTADDVTAIVTKAAMAVDQPSMVIAISDRQGNILGIFSRSSAPPLSTGNFGQLVDTDELAAALARTAAFFSNSQAPLSSRTVRFISGIHFPPGVMYVANGPLYGIENSNRGCSFNAAYIPGQQFPLARSINNGRARRARGRVIANPPGLGIITGKADLNDSDPNAVNPGGVPLYKNGRMVGGIGVAGVAPNVAEYAAFAGSLNAGFLPLPLPDPGAVFINGIELPFVNQTTQPSGTAPIAAGTTLSALGAWVMNPEDSPGPAPEGYLVAATAGPLGGLTQAQVTQIINQAIAVGNETRAAIRLPAGTRAKFVISVADLDGRIIGLYRMPDATVFSIDVSVAKSRNVIYFSGPNRKPSELPGVPMGTAVTNRTIGFGAQPLYPPGINLTNPGPFFPLYQFDAANPCTQGAQPPNPNQNGIVFFPGSLPLYLNGVLVGGLGVSGDGVDQDDFVTYGGAAGFYAPPNLQADQIIDQGARLPYLTFPRNPTD